MAESTRQRGMERRHVILVAGLALLLTTGSQSERVDVASAPPEELLGAEGHRAGA